MESAGTERDGSVQGRGNNRRWSGPGGPIRHRLSMTLVKSPGFFSCRLAHPLSSNVGQVVVFIVRLMVSPHDKNNLKPLRSQSSERSVMTVSFSPLVPIVLVCP